MADQSDERVHEYPAKGLTVRWSKTRCTHAAECVRGLPAVFEPGRRPWVDADRADSVERVVEVIERCPTGALTYERHDGGAEETVSGCNRGRLEADGPIYLRGRVEVEIDGEITTRAARIALCRCGESNNKPLCDGAHAKAGFEAPATFDAARVEDLESPDAAALVVKPAPGGPLVVSGPLEIEAGGTVMFRGEKAALCRCGASQNKPFCDGSHSAAGFEG